MISQLLDITAGVEQSRKQSYRMMRLVWNENGEVHSSFLIQVRLDDKGGKIFKNSLWIFFHFIELVVRKYVCCHN